MKTVYRRDTALLTRRPPWRWRPTAEEGPPRVLLSNLKDPVRVRLGGLTVVAGRMDWMLRLYQHTGATKAGALWTDPADDCEYIAYHPEEWEAVGTVAEWLEYVNRIDGTVCRTDIRSARKYGRMEETSRGERFVIPLAAFTTTNWE